MAQFKVPQNIDLEDKIFGPLTLMQFIYLMAGGMIIYASYELATPFVFWVIAIPVAILTLSLTFLKIQDQPFSKFIVSAVFFFVKPQKRVWSKNPQDEKFRQETMPKRTIKQEKKLAPKEVEKSELETLAGLLDTSSIEAAAAHQKIDLKNNKASSKPKATKNQEVTEDIFQ